MANMHSAMLIILEEYEPPLRRLQLKILNQSPCYLDVCHDNTLSRCASFETVFKCKVLLNVGPDGPDDIISEESSY